MTQFQISRADPTRTRVVDVSEQEYAARLGEGDALLRIDRFGLSANNFTYVVLGDRLGYWQFFPAEADAARVWGVMPVWGFADVVVSRAPGLEVGERLFGYFPPATHLVMKPEGTPGRPLIDASAHRAELPRGYNTYRRVLSDPGYHRADDNLWMLLFPLHITSWALWEALQSATWCGAEQIIIVSASSKTALGLAQALHRDEAAPATVGVTSAGNRPFVEDRELYDSVVSYDDLEATIARRPSVIVDLAGSGVVLARLHRHLGDAMLRSLNVGLTHWDEAGGGPGIIAERSEVFFAPSVIQARMKEWGSAEFARRSNEFVVAGLKSSQDWLTIEQTEGLAALGDRYNAVRAGSLAPDCGLVITP